MDLEMMVKSRSLGWRAVQMTVLAGSRCRMLQVWQRTMHFLLCWQ